MRIKSDPASSELRKASRRRAEANWYANHRDEAIAAMRKRYWDDPEKARKASLDTYYANPERTKTRNARWRSENPDRVREIAARWKSVNEEYLRNYHARYYLANKESFLESNKRRRARMVSSGVIGNITPQSLECKLAYWGHCCWMCGGEFEHWDHVKPLSKNGPHLLANLRPSCARCNLSKSATWRGVLWVSNLRII